MDEATDLPSLDHILSSMFEAILSRRPAQHEILRLTQQIKAGTSLAAIIESFIRSAEYKHNIVEAIGHLDVLPPTAIDLELTSAQRRLLWNHIATIWARMGVSDPYWSVITTDQYRLANMSRSSQIEAFYDSGRADFERFESYLARNGRPFPEDEVCVDYGCGLGRVTLWLARRCRRVLAIDVSKSHLDLARKQLASRGITNVDFHLVQGVEDLGILAGTKLFHSIMALQHNPPPLIGDIISAVFTGLAEDGSAFFQVPTYARNYSWNYQSYSAELMPEQRMELHVLPQWRIFELADKSGCKPLEVQPDELVRIGVPHWISNTFLFSKPANSKRPTR